MPIELELRELLNTSIRARDLRTANVVRMITARMSERRLAPGFAGTVDDALYVEVIQAYRKSLAKGREEYLAAGERGAAQAAELEWEMALCDRFLPKGLGPEELLAAVREAIAATGAKDARGAGRVVGEVLKRHKGRADAGEVKRLVEAELARPVDQA